ncbi:MAG TPA: hypothetical protein V6D22_26380 [Candidatus Obscuribacterales bacterium]
MRKNSKTKSPFLFDWTPGNGPSEEALSNLRDLAPRHPDDPPGEAWFMSETRKTFPQFIQHPVSQIPQEDIDQLLYEITSGLHAFSDATDEVEEWITWFKHLLPDLIIRGDDYYLEFLIEGVISAFLRVYAAGIDSEYSGFRQDILQTIGQAIMKPELWDEIGESVCAQTQRWIAVGNGSLRMPYCSGAISASLFFCLTYLSSDEIEHWIKSVIAIKSRFFRAHFLCWLAGAHPILTGDARPFRAVQRAPVQIDWQNSFLLDTLTPSIPAANIKALFSVVSENLSVEMLLNWIEDMSDVRELAEPLEWDRIAEYVADKILSPALT